MEGENDYVMDSFIVYCDVLITIYYFLFLFASPNSLKKEKNIRRFKIILSQKIIFKTFNFMTI